MDFAGIEGSTLGGDATSVSAGVVGMAPNQGGSFFQSVLYNVVNNLPNMKETTGWNALRMSNSIMYGGTGTTHSRMRNHLDPRNFFRVSDPQAMLDNGASGGGYSIYNTSGLINKYMTPHGATEAARAKAVKKAEKIARNGGSLPVQDLDEVGSEAAKVFSKGRRGGMYSKAVEKGWAAPGTDLAETGMMAKLSTGMRLARMDTVGAGSKWGAKWMARGGGGVVEGMAGMSGRTAAASYMAGAFSSVAGARVGGYMVGARLGSEATTQGIARVAAGMAAGDAGEMAVGGAFVRGSAAVGRHLAGGGLEIVGGKIATDAAIHGVERTGIRAAAAGVRYAAKEAGIKGATKVGAALGARAIGFAIPVVNVAMAAWLAWDVGKMIGGMVSAANKRRAQLKKDVAKSVKGQIDKPVFGMGFVDNEVASTSRSRGVAAIQNSRLNARSVLGSEAGPLAAHFG